MSLPLVQQGAFKLSCGLDYVTKFYFLTANVWTGYAFCYVAIMAIYYSNTWNVRPSSQSPLSAPELKFCQSLSFPMLSTSIFSANGSIYDQQAVFGTNFQLNETALAEVGLPALTGSNAWSNLTSNLSVCHPCCLNFLMVNDVLYRLVD